MPNTNFSLELQVCQIIKAKKPNLVEIENSQDYADYGKTDVTELEYNIIKRWL